MKRTPPRKKGKNIKTSLKWFCSGAGAFVPGYTFFTTYSPPFFPGISILTGVLSAAMIYITSTYNPPTETRARSFEKLIRFSMLFLITAFILLSIYVILLRFCTVLEPQSYEQRFQVGFYKFDFSLTEVGLNLKHKTPSAPIEDWILSEGAFRPGGPEIIWRPWSITIAGLLLVFIYMLGFVLWTVGFSLLAKHKSKPKEPNKPIETDVKGSAA
jgi:hypothetical protein